MRNPPLEDVPTIKVGDLAALPISQLYQLHDQAKQQMLRFKQMQDWLQGAIKLKYREQLERARAEQGKDTGVIHVSDDGYTISEEVAKKVTWNQVQLEQLAHQLANEGEDPRDYIEADLSVSERKYQSWPEKIRLRFESARTMIPSAPRLTIKREA